MKTLGNLNPLAVATILRQVEVAITGIGFEGIIAGVVSITAFFQYFQGLCVDGKAWGAIADDFSPVEILKQLFTADQVLFEVGWINIVAQLMAVTMGSDFMPTFGYLFYKMRQFLGNPAKDEKSRREPIKQIQKAMDVVLDAQFSFIPGIRCNPGLEVFHLEPVFNIDGKKKSGFGHFES